MSPKSPKLAGWAARSSVAVVLLIAALPLLAQDEASPEETPTPEAAAAPEAVAEPGEAAPGDAAPAAAADTAVVADEPATPDVQPVETAEAEDPEATQLDRIQVTGSRIKRIDYETSQPVFSLTREDIKRTGLTDISEILRNITAAGNNSLSAQQGRFALTMGETNLDLRNLGATHTLLLVNGRRWITGLIQTQTSVSDYNTIPTAIIERIEVLKDGASAIYGSDAIGGVVNVITRKDFLGGEASYNLGQFYQQGDGNNQQASVSWGRQIMGDGNLFVNLSYTDQAPAPNENRTISARPNVGPTRNSIVTPNALLRFVELDSTHAAAYRCPNLQAGIGAGAAAGTPLSGPVAMTQIIPGGLVLCDLTLTPGAEGGAGNPADYHQIDRANPLDVYNRFADGTLKEPNERIALYTQFEKPLTSSIGASLESLYNKRESSSVGQNAYLGGGNLDGGQKGYLAYISAANAFNPLAQEIGFDSSCGGPGDANTNPSSTSCTGIGDGSGSWAIRRGPGQNNQTFHDSVETIRLGGGLHGDFSIGSGVFWDAGYIYGRSRIEEILPSVNYEKAALALGSGSAGDTTECENTPGCVPLNVFQGPVGLDPAAVDYIVDDNWQRNRTQQEIAYLNLSTELPSGSWLPEPAAMAIGGEFRRDQYQSAIDPRINEGLIRLNTLNGLDGKTYAREAYVEFGIPLFRGERLAEAMDLDLAARYSNYPRIGGVTTGKAGLRWQLVDDLLLRGTYSTGFRAPNVGELYLGAAQSFDPLADPCADPDQSDDTTTNCTTDRAPGGGQGGNVTTPYDLWQGNRDLQPERSRNLTYGLIYSPSWVPDMNFSLDFYDIEIEDYVVIGQGQFFLDSCYKTPRPDGAAPESGPYCEYIHRDGTGSLTHVDTPYFNLAAVKTAGLDLGFDYVLPLPAQFGRFKLALDGSYLKQFDNIAPVVGQPDEVISSVGTASGQFQGFPRWKAGGYLTWSRNQLKASWSTRMAYHMTEPCGDFFPTPSLNDLGLCSDPAVMSDDPVPEVLKEASNRLHTVFYHNAQVGYALTQYNAEITIGVNNLLDQDPQISRSLTSLYWYNFDPNHYEVPGRFGYMRAEYRF